MGVDFLSPQNCYRQTYRICHQILRQCDSLDSPEKASHEKSTMADKENSPPHENAFSLYKEKIFPNMLKMEVFDLESINDVGVVNISSFCKCDVHVLHKMLIYLYGYQFCNSCEI